MKIKISLKHWGIGIWSLFGHLEFGAWNLITYVLIIVWSLVIGNWLLFFPSPVFAGELSNHFTVELWVKPSGSVASKAILVKNNEIRLVTDSSGKPLCQVNNGTSWQTVATSSTALSINTWQFVLCVHDGSNTKVYLNASQKGSAAVAANVNNGTATFEIARDAGTNYGYFAGKIDEVMIWNYALTQKQIESYYNAGAVRFGQ